MLKNKIKSVIEKLLGLKSELHWKRSINRIYKSLGIKSSDVDPELILQHKKYWSSLKKNVNTKWFKVYNYLTKNPDICFVPENIYFNIIEPRLNNRKLAQAYMDKNLYELLYGKKDIFPESIVRNIDGSFYDREYNLLNAENGNLLQDYLKNYQKIILKPSIESGGGKRIQLFERFNEQFVNKGNQVLNLKYLEQSFETNYIIQNYLQQSHDLAKFNPTSLNTVRIFTYRSVLTDEVYALHSVLRIGKKGNIIDDQNAGGVACYINADCTLNSFATDIVGNKYYEFNGVSLSGIKIPKVAEMKAAAAELAKKNIHSRVLGFDFALDKEENIRLIEVNHLWTGISFFQMNSSSVFGKYTDEVVRFCRN